MTAESGTLPEDYTPRIHRAVVLGTRRLTPGMVRITLGGPDMADYPTTGIGDEYVRLFFPDRVDEPVRLPVIADRGWDFPEGVEPSEMRTYTIRRHRAGEVDIDFVVHEGGIAAQWAMEASEGCELGINQPHGLYERPAETTRQILLTDEPGLPAALRIAEVTPVGVQTLIIAELRDAAHALTAEVDSEDVAYRWLRGTGNGDSPSQLIHALKREDLSDAPYIWLASEGRVMREGRRLLRQTPGYGRTGHTCVGYWIERAEEWRARYEALGPEFRQRVMDMYDEDRDLEDIADDVIALYESHGL